MAPDSATLSRTKTAGQKVAHGRIAEPVLVTRARGTYVVKQDHHRGAGGKGG